MKSNKRVFFKFLLLAAIGTVSLTTVAAVAAEVAAPNLAKLEMEGILIENDVVVIEGPAWKVDRSKSFTSDGKPLYSPGAAQEQNFIIEMSGADATRMKKYFDTHLFSKKKAFKKPKKGLSGSRGAANPKNAPIKAASLIVRNSAGSEVYRWNLFEFKPYRMKRSGGRTQFEFRQKQNPDLRMQYELSRAYVTGNVGSQNPAKDTHFEISRTGASFYPEVTVNRSAHTITVIYDHNEGRGMYGWLKDVVSGKQRRRVIADGSLIQRNSSGRETSRENFYGMFPIEFKVIQGVGRDNQTKIQAVLSYDFSENATN